MTDFSAGNVVVGGAYGYAEHLDGGGAHIQHIELRDDDGNLMKVWGACFDKDGDAHFALGQIATYEDYTPHDICYIPGTDSPKEFAVLIGRIDDTLELWIVDEDHNVLDTFTGLDVDTGWDHTQPTKLAVLCDGDTVYYTDQGTTIFTYSISGGQQADYATRSDGYIFGGIDVDRAGNVYVAATPNVNEGVGPQRDVSLGSATSIWTDQVGETPVNVYKRQADDFSIVLASHTVSLDPSDTNDEVLSIAAYYYPCSAELLTFYHILGA